MPYYCSQSALGDTDGRTYGATATSTRASSRRRGDGSWTSCVRLFVCLSVCLSFCLAKLALLVAILASPRRRQWHLSYVIIIWKDPSSQIQKSNFVPVCPVHGTLTLDQFLSMNFQRCSKWFWWQKKENFVQKIRRIAWELIPRG